MLILASQSATRKTLLNAVAIPFAVESAAIDERKIERLNAADGASRRDIALALARAKALATSAEHPDAMVIGADQTLEFGEREIHKPDSRETAAAQLRALAGKTHYLHAAAALARGNEILWQTVETAEITMRDFAASELETVLDLEGEAVFGAVGGYRLEGPSVRLFESVKGDYFTVLGLPLLALIAALRLHAPDLFLPGSKK